MNKYNKKSIKVFYIIMIVVVLTLAVTYAYLVFTATNTSNTGTAGCFVVNYTGQNINNSGLNSTTSYTEGAVSEIVLSRNTGCKIYNEASINLHTNSSNTNAPLNSGAFKYRVMKDTTLVKEGVVNAVSAGNEEQLLATVPLTDTATTYKVYLWVDSAVSNGAFNGKAYSGYLYASSIQSSTLKS